MDALFQRIGQILELVSAAGGRGIQLFCDYITANWWMGAVAGVLGFITAMWVMCR